MAEGARLHGDHIRPFGLARNDGSVSNSFVGIAGQSSREWPLGDTDAAPCRTTADRQRPKLYSQEVRRLTLATSAAAPTAMDIC